MAVLAAGLFAAPPAALAQSTMTDGLVIKIDQAAGKITIKHGPLKQFEMDEGMTMVYRADNPAMLKNIRVSDKIKFVARPLTDHHRTISIHAVNLKYRLRNIETNRANLAHGRLPSLWFALTQPPFGTSMS